MRCDVPQACFKSAGKIPRTIVYFTLPITILNWDLSALHVDCQ